VDFAGRCRRGASAEDETADRHHDADEQGKRPSAGPMTEGKGWKHWMLLFPAVQ
jgi:hypothetical protein